MISMCEVPGDWLMTGILDQFSLRDHFSSSRKFNSLAVARSCRSFCHSLAVDLPWKKQIHTNPGSAPETPKSSGPACCGPTAVLQPNREVSNAPACTHEGEIQNANVRLPFTIPSICLRGKWPCSDHFRSLWQKVVYLMCFMTMDGMGLLKTHGRVSGWGLIRRSWGETPMDQSMFDSKSRPCFSLMFFMFIDP